jgi:starch synthase
MDILFVATELAPTVKVGGLGDVVSSLSKTLRNNGHKVTIALPRYPVFEQSGMMCARRLTPLALGSGTAPLLGDAPGMPSEAIVFDTRLSSGVEVVLLDANGPDGASIFGSVTSEAGNGIYDGDESVVARRFATFNRAVMALLEQRAAAGQTFDIVHVHDWPTAMVPYLMRENPALARTRSVLSIHNLAHQGFLQNQAGRDALAAFGLGNDHFTPARLEFYGGVSLLKGGILAADAVTTVSPTYAQEILGPERGERLDGVLRARFGPGLSAPQEVASRAEGTKPGDSLLGILNGIDYASWNPATDASLPARFDADDPSNKARVKSTVLAGLGLSIDPERPLFVSIGRQVHQKGADVLANALPRLLRQDVTIVIAGEGDASIGEHLAAAAARDGERIKVLGRVSEQVAHGLYGAADFVLLPSRFEPCGLVQVHAQRYGALPIATRTGGFIDTIVDLDSELETGTGFLIDSATEDALVGGVGRALAAFNHPRFPAVRKRVMRLDLSWERPARRYMQLYRQLSQASVVAEAPAQETAGA